MVAPVVLAVAAFIAGHPVTVSCDAATNRPPSVPTGALGWSVVGGSESHLSGDVCNDLEDSPGGLDFAAGIAVLIHEAAHAKGVRSEACAQWYAVFGVYDVLRRFYAIPFFTDESRLIGAEVLEFTKLRLPPEYQPSLTSSCG